MPTPARNLQWSPQARQWLADQQADLYAQLGERSGLGRDADRAFRAFARPAMPDDWIAPARFEATFADTWAHAPGWGSHRAAIDGFLQRRKDLELPTRFEDANWYPTMVEMALALEDTLSQTAYPLSFRPLLGSLPSGEINAMSVLLPGTGEYVVLFEHGLFEFMFRIAQVLAASFPPLVPDGSGARFESVPAPADALRNAPAVVDRFVDAVGAYVVHGNPHRAAAFALAPAHRVTAMTLVRAVEMFVLGHEYAHVFLGHLREPGPEAAGAPAVDTSWTWQQEYDADEVGWSFADRTLSLPEPLSYLGPELFYASMDALDRCLAVLDGVPLADVQQSDTHPAAPQRRDRLRGELLDILQSPARRDSALALGSAVQEAFDALWEASEPRWRALRDGGTRPSALWSS